MRDELSNEVNDCAGEVPRKEIVGGGAIELFSLVTDGVSLVGGGGGMA